MSGTSLDGLDLVYVKFTKRDFWNFKILASKTYHYDSNWITKLSGSIDISSKAMGKLDIKFSNFLSEKILVFIEEFKIEKLDGVGSHGHTVIHQPNKGFTHQIGNLKLVADKIQKPFVCDFRTQDVLLGGQGAPLVPVGDKFLFHNYDACLNLGGFSNVTLKKENGIEAYDICALNTILNYLANRLNLPYDNNGDQAKNGKFIDQFYQDLEKLPFYDLKPPKSLGIEWVRDNLFLLLDKYSDRPVEDLLNTYTVHCATQIANNLISCSSVLLSGGGTHNSFLVSAIKNKTDCKLVIPIRELVDFKEAIIFAFLSVLKLRGEINCFASVTGARYDHSSGKIFTPNPIID